MTYSRRLLWYSVYDLSLRNKVRWKLHNVLKYQAKSAVFYNILEHSRKTLHKKIHNALERASVEVESC